MIFKAKIKGKNEYIEGDSLVKADSNNYVIFKDGLDWVDGSEWNAGRNWEYIEIETLEIIKHGI